MKKLLGLATAIAVIFAVASPAIAKPLNFKSTLTSVIADLPALTQTGGGVATVNGSTGLIPAHLDTIRLAATRGIATGTQTVFVTDPNVAANGIFTVIVEYQPRTGTLGPISGAAASTSALTQRVLPIGGVARLCVLAPGCSATLALPLTVAGTKGVGIGGQLTVGGFSSIRISVDGAPWTIKTATAIDQTNDNVGTMAFHEVTAKGFVHGPASATTSATAQPGGVLQIVTPSQIRTNLPLGSNVKLAVLTTLIVEFIPEPGLLLLLGSGVVGLAVLGRNRMKS